MPIDDKIEVGLGDEAIGEEPAINTVTIRCARDGELLIARDCQNMAEVGEIRSAMERMEFSTEPLDTRLLEIERHFGMARELCRGCGSTLFRKNRLPHGGWAMDPDMRLDLQSEGGAMFFRCEQCGGRNYVVRTDGPHGLTTLEIQRFEK
jgi:hypothetical protein